MKKRAAEELLNGLGASVFASWYGVETPESLQGLPSGFSSYRFYTTPVNQLTHLVVGLGIDLRHEEVDVVIGWSDAGNVESQDREVAAMRRGSIEWHRQGKPTEEFSNRAFRRSLGGLVKVGVPKKYPAVGELVDIANSIRVDLEAIGAEYWQVMLKRRFELDLFEPPRLS